MKFIVNAEAEVIHTDPAGEICNTDSIKKKSKIGWREFFLLIREGFHPCDHCFLT